ncbi:hypothetical protein [Kiloniella majae]|uniref:hypothetical protein n=1 Tax=Kiloniella majae TaxID=1938558 RepID=UPI000A2792F6|nr:hypothetical protein [Kiloniella majae]
MTISATPRRATYNGDGSTVTFAVPFKFLADSHLVVVLTDAEGVEVIATPSSVSGAGDANGGSVTLTSAPAVDVSVTVLGRAPIEQQTDLAISDGMPADVIETAVDQLTIQNQEQKEEIGRAIKLPVSHTGSELQFPAPVPNEVPYYDENGKLVMSSVGFSTLMSTVSNLITLAQQTGQAHTHTLASITDAKDWAKKDPSTSPAKTENYTLVEADDGKVIPFDATGAARTIPLLPAATAGNGFSVTIKKTDASANAVTIDGDGSEVIDGAETLVLSAQNDAIELRCDGTGWQVVSKVSSGGGGLVVKSAHVQYSGVATGTSTIPLDDTKPQNTEGTEFMTLAFTPTDAANELEIEVVFNFSNSANNNQHVALFKDSDADAIASAPQMIDASQLGNVSFKYRMTAGTTSEITFKVRSGGNSSGTTTFNGRSSARLHGGSMASSISIKEIKV